MRKRFLALTLMMILLSTSSAYANQSYNSPEDESGFDAFNQQVDFTPPSTQLSCRLDGQHPTIFRLE